jgi:hypothetical protein
MCAYASPSCFLAQFACAGDPDYCRSWPFWPGRQSCPGLSVERAAGGRVPGPDSERVVGRERTVLYCAVLCCCVPKRREHARERCSVAERERIPEAQVARREGGRDLGILQQLGDLAAGRECTDRQHEDPAVALHNLNTRHTTQQQATDHTQRNRRHTERSRPLRRPAAASACCPQYCGRALPPTDTAAFVPEAKRVRKAATSRRASKHSAYTRTDLRAGEEERRADHLAFVAERKRPLPNIAPRWHVKQRIKRHSVVRLCARPPTKPAPSRTATDRR